MRTRAAWPEHCVKCGAPAHAAGRLQSIVWHSPVWYLLLISPVLYLFAVVIWRKRTEIAPRLCGTHASRHTQAHALAWAIGASAFAAGIAGLAKQNFLLGLLALVLFLATVVHVRLCVWILRPVHMSDDEVHLKGCGEAFLGNLHLAS